MGPSFSNTESKSPGTGECDKAAPAPIIPTWFSSRPSPLRGGTVFQISITAAAVVEPPGHRQIDVMEASENVGIQI
jgi:hypothetical protein